MPQGLFSVLLLLFFLGLQVNTATQAGTTQSTGEKILADTTLFPGEFAKAVRSVIDETSSCAELSRFTEYGELDFCEGPAGTKAAVEKAAVVGFRVPEKHQPKIEEIRKKYGEPDKVLEDQMPGSTYPEREKVTFYCYGKVRFGVPKDRADGRIIWVNIHMLE